LKKALFVLLLIATTAAHSQDVTFAKKVVDTLTSPWFWGRGYTNDGMGKAARYISAEFKAFGLLPTDGKSYLQPFTFPVNTFPSKMELQINGKTLLAGKDFIISQDSRGVKGAGQLQRQDSTHFVDAANRIVIEIKDKLTWSVAPEAADYTSIIIDKNSMNEVPATYKVNVENKVISSFKAGNVCGFVKGTSKPDSLIVFTAHYDHLGGMGAATYFPGANDNASGISLLLGLAKYYAKNPQPYSVAFICFAGEEAGLLGSKYFTEHPLVPLKSIRFLTNVDLVGTGDEGITVVNATEYKSEFAWLNEINDKEKLLTKINARGKAANSDHYWFSEKGVPAFFIYTLGGIKAYHDVFDKGATLPLNEYEDLFKLILQFNSKMMSKE
jgi:aminopeptidase YwaD